MCLVEKLAPFSCLDGKISKKGSVRNKQACFRLSARRRRRCNFLRSSRIRVHPTPAASTMPPKFDPNEIKVGACFRCGRGFGMRRPSPYSVRPAAPPRWPFPRRASRLLPPRGLPSGATFRALCGRGRVSYSFWASASPHVDGEGGPNDLWRLHSPHA